MYGLGSLTGPLIYSPRNPNMAATSMFFSGRSQFILKKAILESEVGFELLIPLCVVVKVDIRPCATRNGGQAGGGASPSMGRNFDCSPCSNSSVVFVGSLWRWNHVRYCGRHQPCKDTGADDYCDKDLECGAVATYLFVIPPRLFFQLPSRLVLWKRALLLVKNKKERVLV
eukprot:COSAG01_NODE_4793_length_4740_cov_3.755441_4_plen_171_part_00